MGKLEKYLQTIIPPCVSKANQFLTAYNREIERRFFDKDRFREFVAHYDIQRIPGFRADNFYAENYAPNIDHFLARKKNLAPSECIDLFKTEFCWNLPPERKYLSFASKILYVSWPTKIPIYDRYAFSGFRFLWSVCELSKPESTEEWRRVFFDDFQKLLNECDKVVEYELSAQCDQNLLTKIRAFDFLLMKLGGAG